jgi:hypothetical protein
MFLDYPTRSLVTVLAISRSSYKCQGCQLVELQEEMYYLFVSASRLSIVRVASDGEFQKVSKGLGEHRNVVVKALCYMSEGRWFETR